MVQNKSDNNTKKLEKNMEKNNSENSNNENNNNENSNSENSNSQNSNNENSNKPFISMNELLQKKKKLIHQYFFIIYNNYHKNTKERIYCIYSINDVWNTFIGKEYTLQTNSLKELLLLLDCCKYEWNEYSSKYKEYLSIQNEINSLDTIQTWCLLFFKFKNKSNFYLNSILEKCSSIKIKNNLNFEFLSKRVTSNLITSNNSNNSNNSNWYQHLIKKYEQYNGPFPTTPKKFILYFKTIWDKISDNDTIEISYILINILGGISINNNAYCLTDYIFNNKDIIHNYNDWIFI